MRIFALHGFLGQASDFSNFFDHLQRETKNSAVFFKDKLQWHSVDYLAHPALQPHTPLAQWGSHFNRFIFNQNLGSEKKVLIGYSQGARLAMQAYENDPSFWDKLILVSGNPGIPVSERKIRLVHDEKWSEKFLKGDFMGNIRDWNLQSVFSGSKNEPLRHEGDYDKTLLSLALKNWSVAWQNDFSATLLKPEHSKKILVVVGGRDEKYKTTYGELNKKNPRLQVCEIEDSGHRIIFDQPAKLAKVCADFITQA